jgi:2-haloacid dehalogenase
VIDLDSFEILSFDCYGTLVDWESGILSTLAPILARHRRSAPAQELLEAYGRLEARAEEPPYRPYAIVLREVMEGLGRMLGFTPAGAELDALASSIASWAPFPDTREALRALRTKYRLAILSNIDDDLFALTAPALGVELDWVVTAGQVHSYKPALENFRRALVRFGLPKEKVLHVAQSLFHDIAPARALGLASVWVNRRHGLPGAGATPPADGRPDLEVRDLKSLASLAGVS